MRRNVILLIFSPLADALSLANFQQITSTLIPISCLLTYDSQIPSCKVNDFQDGCSSACQSALTSVASDVSQACSDVSVSSSTLLGIVMNGGILQALCPTTGQTTTTPVAKSTSAIAQSTPAADSVTIPTTSPGVQLSTTAADSVTIPTTSPGVQLSTTISTTSKSQSATFSHSSVPKTSSAQSTEITSSLESSTAAAPSSTTESAEPTSSSSTKKQSTTSKTTTAAAASTQKGGQESETQGKGSGGGSPFDISSTGTRVVGGSMFAFVIAAWACVLLGR